MLCGMKIQSLPPNPSITRPGLPGAEKNSPWTMDRFELQQEVWDAERQVINLRHQSAAGHQRALVGMGVLFTSLGVMAAQSILSGGSLPPSLSVPLVASSAVGLTAFASGIWKRDTAAMEVDSARFEAERLKGIQQQRFPHSV